MKVMIIGSLLSTTLITAQANPAEPVAYLTPAQVQKSEMMVSCADFQAVAYRGEIYTPKGNNPDRPWKKRSWHGVLRFVSFVCPDQTDTVIFVRRMSETR